MKMCWLDVRRIAWLLCVALALTASVVSAQSRLRVTRDQATIWRSGFTTAATVVKQGTELEAVARRGTWYEVILPGSEGAAGATGLIAVSQAELISGPPPPERPLTAAAAARPQPPPSQSAVVDAPIGVRAFGDVGFQWFNAHQTFDAVFGQPGGFLFGGGVEFRAHGVFVQGAAERFRRTGQRVFASGGDVFGLGVPDVVTITPLSVTAGYRLHLRRANPYVGAGMGRMLYTETSDFAEPSENVDTHFTSYHVLFGVQWLAANPWWATAFEVQYTHVPNALNGGVADLLGERNLGGIEARVKIEIGK